MFMETVDVCGTYSPVVLPAAPPTINYAFYITYEGGGAHGFACPNGSHHNGYTWAYRKGSIANPPDATFGLGLSSGYVHAMTEVTGDYDKIGADYYGCDHNKVCTNPSFGLHLLSGSTWNLWTTSTPGHSVSNQPPWLHANSNPWGFWTCKVAC